MHAVKPFSYSMTLSAHSLLAELVCMYVHATKSVLNL